MSISEEVRQKIHCLEVGNVFSNEQFMRLGSRAAVDQALSRLVKRGEIDRVARGVFVRPKYSRFVGKVLPATSQIVELIARQNGETVQIHGAEAARRFKLSTQMPVLPVYYTNGPTRTLMIGNRPVKFMHTSSQRKLQHAGSKVGLAISALWYLGKELVTTSIIEKVRACMTEEEFKTLKESKLPAWLMSVIEQSQPVPFDG